jgi:hypothetical protein
MFEPPFFTEWATKFHNPCYLYELLQDWSGEQGLTYRWIAGNFVADKTWRKMGVRSKWFKGRKAKKNEVEGNLVEMESESRVAFEEGFGSGLW